MRFVVEWRMVVGRGREIKELREKMGMNRREWNTISYGSGLGSRKTSIARLSVTFD